MKDNFPVTHDAFVNSDHHHTVRRIGLRVFSSASWIGGINYVLNWARALRTLPPTERPEVLFLHADDSGRLIAEEHRHLVDRIEAFREARHFALDFVYPATQVAEAPFGAPWAAWVPDWQCKHLPEMFDAAERARRDLTYRTLATAAPLLVLSSQMALEDTRRVIGPDTVPLRRLHFPAVLDDDTYLTAPQDIAEAKHRYGLPERYILVCNQFWRHKNHRVVFEALAKDAAQDIVCAFTGDTRDQRWPDYFVELQALIGNLGIGERVRILGRIDRRNQMLLLLGAAGVVQPSRFEGWSTVVEECRAIGKPIILSDFPVHREQSPPGSRFVGMENADALATAMRALWEHATPLVLPTQQRERHRAYVQHCARALLSVARETRDAYDPVRHDPSVIMARVLGDLHRRRKQLDGVQAALRQRTTAVIRTILKDHPEGLAAFMHNVREDYRGFDAEARAQIEAPTASMMSEPARLAYMALADGRQPSRLRMLRAQLVRTAKAAIRRLVPDGRPSA